MGVTSQFGDRVVRTFAASVDEVWTVVADLDRIGEWSPECVGIEWDPPAGGPAVGTRFIGRNAMGPVRWSTTCEIEQWSPLVRFSYVARHVTGASTLWTFELAPHAGGTTVTQAFVTVGSPGWMMALERLVRRPHRLRAGMEATLGAMEAAVADQAAKP